jgi:hypothetical protein
LRVNAIGGGSWVTEFEVITGVDSRFFGYHGFYTHYYIAPRVRRSFIHHLADRGYATAVYYPTDRAFYNAGVAFDHYGFSTFVDATDLELPPDWTHLVDREIVDAVVRHGAFERPGPFVYFLSTSENHGPHPCRSFSDASELVTTFEDDVDFELNCQLNEYLKRAASTAAGVELVLEQLKRIEEESGRPFVLLVYGDHQPWSFTEGVFSVAGGVATDSTTTSFSGVRSEAGADQTVFHIMSSVEGLIVADMPDTVSATLLPTLVSGYTARSLEDLYLPVNLMAAAECGADLLSSNCARRNEIRSSLRDAILNDP